MRKLKIYVHWLPNIIGKPFLALESLLDNYYSKPWTESGPINNNDLIVLRRSESCPNNNNNNDLILLMRSEPGANKSYLILSRRSNEVTAMLCACAIPEQLPLHWCALHCTAHCTVHTEASTSHAQVCSRWLGLETRSSGVRHHLAPKPGTICTLWCTPFCTLRCALFCTIIFHNFAQLFCTRRAETKGPGLSHHIYAHMHHMHHMHTITLH